LARHGTYERKHPPGAHVARWRCPEGHCTFSLLPDCLAARLPGALVELEAVIAVAEQATSVEAAANAVRTDDIGLVGAIRWVLRRRNAVHANLLVLKELLPERFAECPPTVAGFGRRLGTDRALEGPGREPPKPFTAARDGFSLNAAVACKAGDRRKLERLCRYVARPAIALERLNRGHRGPARDPRRPRPAAGTTLSTSTGRFPRRCAWSAARGPAARASWSSAWMPRRCE
jgi:hypothetical protein